MRPVASPDAPINLGMCTMGQTNGQPFSMNLGDLSTHVLAIGGSGSGKSVVLKHCCEHLLMYNIPIVAIDVVGDLTGLCVPDTDRSRQQLGLHPPPFRVSEIGQAHGEGMASMLSNHIIGRVLTPCSNSGERLAVPPVAARPANWEDLFHNDLDYLTITADTVSYHFLKRVGLGNKRAGDGPDIMRGIITDALLAAWKKDHDFSGKDGIANFIQWLRDWGAPPLPPDAMNKIATSSMGLLTGAEALWLQGTPLDFSQLLKPVDGKTPVVSISLTGIDSSKHPWVVAQVITSLRAWASRQGPITGIPRVGLFIDELRGEQGADAILPKATYRSPSGDAIRRLLRQGRHWGMAAFCGTQYPNDVDSATFSNFGTRFVGRLLDENAIKNSVQGIELGTRAQMVMRAISAAPANHLLAIKRNGSFERVWTHCLGTTHPKIAHEQFKLLYQHGYAWKPASGTAVVVDRRVRMVQDLDRVAATYHDILDDKQRKWLQQLADFHRR
jgi:hypothetical protein